MTVIPFPSCRRIGKVRSTAKVLHTKHGRDAELFWRQVIDGMRSQMVAAGIAEDDIEHELRAFSGAVFTHMRVPGGAA